MRLSLFASMTIISLYSALFAFLAVFVGLHRLLRILRKPETHRFNHLPDLATEEEEEDSPSRSLWKYDVFLSFRGTDVRSNFLSHLYEALNNEGIKTFHDDRELRKGNFIWEGLEEGMNQSRFAIVVISKDYGTSHWCLEELLRIIHLAEKKRIELIPVFYEIDPSDLKRGSGCFNEALEKHKLRYDHERVEMWRMALARVGNISGWDSKSRKEESKLVQGVVQDLSVRLFSRSSSDTDGLVGMVSHMRSVESLLSMDSGDVRMVGIWGMGGIGKTTIAKFVCKRLSSKFDGFCVLENVKTEFEQYGASHMRRKVLAEFLRLKEMNTWDGDIGVMKRRLRGKMVLLVLDDVDNIEQLEGLAGSCEWFGPGSRIVITTRDKRVLDQHVVEHIYEVKPLRTTQALQLFSKHAFRMNRPQEEFIKLSIDIVEQLGGLPLALRVIGASLYRREIAFWEDKLLILKNSLDKSVSLVLKVSYDALDDQEKIVFLYIARCFNGEYMERAKKLLDPFVIASGPSLVTLMKKSLISMSKKRRLRVHDLLQDMAKDIICEGKREKPWKRRMLWMFSDVKGLFSENMGAKDIVVESILLSMAEETELCINPARFKRMFNLKFLKIHNNLTVGGSKICMVNDLDYLPPLRYLHWEAYTPKSLPSHFQTDYLVELNLSDSSVETLWNGTQELQSLKHMNLNRCRHLVEIPDLSKAKSLESLRLCNCESLVDLHSSLWHLNDLVVLSMQNCTKLKNLPSNISLKSLKTLHLDGCTSIEDFPSVSESIEELGLSRTSIEIVPTSIERLSRLRYLRLSQCKRLKNLPDTIGSLESLRHLWLGNCPSITVFPLLGNGIKILGLNGTAIEEVPPSIGDKMNLLLLEMSDCQRLVNLPPTLSNLKNLKFLYLRGCTNITELPQIAGEMRKLDLYGTSIEKYGFLSEDEVLKMRKRDMEFLKGYLTRFVQKYKKNRNSR